MMVLGMIKLSVVSQTEKDKYDIINMWNLKIMIHVNLCTEQK